MKTSVTICAGALLAVVQVVVNGNPVYKDANAPIESRVADLLSRMTIEEKTAQLIQGDVQNYLNLVDGTFNASGLAWNMENRALSIWTGYYTTMEIVNKGAKIAQDYLMHNTTLGIPAFIQSEGIHGVLLLNATIFNSPIAFACSWNPNLVAKMANAIAVESLAVGVNQVFAPLADLARELRYGRVEETYGEDPYLVGEIAYAYITGLQAKGVSATVKHFAAFASPEQGLNTGPVHGGERELRTTFLPSFRRAIIDANAYGIMSSYNSYDGVPMVSNTHVLTDILRNEWGYKYYVTSDAGGTARLADAFLVCPQTPLDACNDCITLSSLPAGNDVEMGGGKYSFARVPALVAAGKLPMSVVDTAVSRVLRAKFALGLFENPYQGVADADLKKFINTDEHKQLARELDADSIVLLENHNNVLPLKKTASIAVIGPMAHGYVNYGDYVIHTAMTRGVTPLDGIQAASHGKVTYAKGCERWSNDESGFPAAVAAAKAADVAVVVVGTWSRDQNELWEGLNATTGEHVDVADLRLVGAMPKLVEAIINTGKPTVVVYSSGKPITEPWISDAASALVQQFYGSEQMGNALADVLFGDVNPSGKLAVGFPYDVGALPVYYDYLNSGRTYDPGMVYPNGSLRFGHQYVLQNPDPLYEFGYGKSYSNFSYSNVSISPRYVSTNDTVTVSVKVKNTSNFDGQEVVQVYVKDLLATVAVPNIQLKGFSKAMIKSGATQEIQIMLNVSDWGLWNSQMQYVVEPGDFAVSVGSSSKNFYSTINITVT